MSPWVLPLASLILAFIVAAVAWISIAYKKVKTDAKEITNILDTINSQGKEIENVKRLVNGHENMFNAVNLRMTEFGYIQKSVTGLENGFRDLVKKMDDRNEKVDNKMDEMNDLMHQIHIEIVKKA